MVDPILHNDLVTIMEEESETVQKQYQKGTFKNLFWEQQLKAARAKGPCKWHQMAPDDDTLVPEPEDDLFSSISCNALFMQGL